MTGTSTSYIGSPLGSLVANFDNHGALVRLEFCAETNADTSVGGAAAAAAKLLERQLGEYFARRRCEFDLPLAPAGTHFQLAVWDELRRIPWGRTLSYAELARRVDATLGATAAQNAGLDPAAAPGGSLRIRAVGRANALNPIAILIPCHRVVGSGGRLTGYAGGLWRKQALLELEGVLTPLLC